MFGIVVLHITSLSTNEIGRYLTYQRFLQNGSRPHVASHVGRYCCPARWTILLSRTLDDIVVPHVGRWQLSGSVYVFHISISYSDVIYTHIHTRSIDGLRCFASLSLHYHEAKYCNNSEIKNITWNYCSWSSGKCFVVAIWNKYNIWPV